MTSLCLGWNYPKLLFNATYNRLGTCAASGAQCPIFLNTPSMSAVVFSRAAIAARLSLAPFVNTRHVSSRHFLVQISFQIQPAPRTRHAHRLGNLQRLFAAYFWSVEHLDHHYEANHQSRFHLAHNKYINAERLFDSTIEGILYQAQVRIKW